MLVVGSGPLPLQVEVQNKEGLVKEKAHCAPNGYFFVPVYDQVKPRPAPWILSPQP